MTSLEQIENIVKKKKAELIQQNTRFPIYLDYQSTTPVNKEVLESMIPYFTHHFGNPHSRTHSYGWEAESAIEEAREHIAKCINCDKKEIIFTSGATESNNLALKGVARFYRSDKKNHIVTVLTEHKCIINTCRKLEEEGFEVTYLTVNSDGTLDLEKFKASIKESTILASVMMVNNEIGVIHPMKQIGEICKQAGIFLHSDIAQSFGKMPIDVNNLNIDLASITAHKIYGPKGIGALYVRKKPRVRLQSIFDGGGQERGMRSGTNSTPLIVGFGHASKIALQNMQKNSEHVKFLRGIFLDILFKNLEYIYLNGTKDDGYPGNINISFAYVEGESLILAIKDLAVSSGSACTSASLEPSYVLRSMGIDDDLAHTSIRFSFGINTKKEEVEYAAYLVIYSVLKLREMSPLWELKQEGVDINSIQWTMH